MKAIATVAVTQPQLVTPGAIFASAVVTGLLWLGLGSSGAVSWLAALTGRPPFCATWAAWPPTSASRPCAYLRSRGRT